MFLRLAALRLLAIARYDSSPRLASHKNPLPTEFNASFARALPMLDAHKILKDVDRRHARRLLTAAALTYVSASLASLLNIARWWAILRR